MMIENHETRSLMNELQTLREEFRQIACFIRELKRDYSVLEEKIELSTSDVLHLLGISKASLARWRALSFCKYRQCYIQGLSHLGGITTSELLQR